MGYYASTCLNEKCKGPATLFTCCDPMYVHCYRCEKRIKFVQLLEARRRSMTGPHFKAKSSSMADIGKDDFVMEIHFAVPKPQTEPYTCERCGVRVVPTSFQFNNRTSWNSAHNAPCGRRCLPGLDTYVSGGPPHISKETCEVCKKEEADMRIYTGTRPDLRPHPPRELDEAWRKRYWRAVGKLTTAGKDARVLSELLLQNPDPKQAVKALEELAGIEETDDKA